MTGNEELVKQVETDYRKAGLDEKDMAMLRFAEKMTRTPARMTQDDVESLRSVGFSDKEILDITHIAALFNYLDRVADALGTQLDSWKATPG